MTDAEAERRHSTDPAPDRPVWPDGESLLAENRESYGPKGPEPTRFGDWERKGRCVDF